MDLALKNLQWLICHKTQPTKQPTPTLGKLAEMEFDAFVNLFVKRVC